mmetsp:Transcript_25067/g.51934  ORF Transcript_25067/g.51934 Transcript_25067/m.51934 type:complete len:262 (-) Transcript_25067:331-1116(-)
MFLLLLHIHLGDNKFQSPHHGLDLRQIAILPRHPLRIGIHLRRRHVPPPGDAATQPQLLRRDQYHPLSHRGLVDDGSLFVRGGDVRHFLHRLDDGGQKVQRRIERISHQIKSIGDGFRLVGKTGLGVFGGHEFRGVRVGRFVQVHVDDPRGEAVAFARGRFLFRGLPILRDGLGLLRRPPPSKRAIGIHRLGIPPLDVLVRPGRHAGHDRHAEPIGVILRFGLEESNGPLHSRRFVAVHSSRDQQTGLVDGGGPVFGLYGV